MGKRKVLSEEALKELVLPEKGEMLGRVVKLMGSDHIMVQCADGVARLGRIRGKLKRRIWIREGDVVLVAPWDFKTNERCDILWRYTVGQVDYLRDKGHLPKEL
ncbi:MAG: translation initiation factor eIF-1A [Nitrososphaerota archaeon]|nr:translation initiation factor eIF-1A [Nitrososphaerota archaeon]MDG6939988.1 translation initiation factor eIF-1A [Nitrososphaerota archaeon]